MRSFRKKRRIGKRCETRDLGQPENKKQGSAPCGMWDSSVSQGPSVERERIELIAVVKRTDAYLAT